MIKVLTVRMSRDQQEVVLDHFLNEAEMGILESERGWIRHHINAYLSSLGMTLVKIIHASPVMDDLAWRVECEVNDGKETEENEIEQLHS